MTSPELERLVGTGQLVREAPMTGEVPRLQHSGEARLNDARNVELSLDGRFDLRQQGYRPKNRAIVFQVLPHTLGSSPSVWRVLSKAHGIRNRTEYDGVSEPEERLVTDLIVATAEIAGELRKLLKPD